MSYGLRFVESAPTTAPAERISFEPRWPVALAVTSYIGLTLVLRVYEPEQETVGPRWLVPGIEVGLLVLLLLADPARIEGRRRWLRRAAIWLVTALLGIALLATAILVKDLIEGGKVTNEASSLLSSGALIYLGNALSFSLFYWLLDSGGPLARYHGERPYPDFAFTQHQAPELAPPGWRPHYVDYMVLGLTTNMAFSPTDVMPMARWAKLAMTLQSLIAVTVIGLVIARAVNVFG